MQRLNQYLCAVSLFLAANVWAADPGLLPSKVEACRTAAGFGTNNQFVGRATPVSIVLCTEAVASHPDITIASAFLGRALYSNGREKDAAAPIKRSADAGDPVGMLLMGVALDFGYGMQASLPSEPLEWYRKAAKANHPNGQFNYALRLIASSSPQYVPEARRELEASAAQGTADAVRVLGWLRIRGIGERADKEGGLRLYRQAADAGDAAAARNLALLLFRTDPTEAAQRVRAAVQSGDELASLLLAEWSLRGRVVPRDPAAAVHLLRPLSNEWPRAKWLLGASAERGWIASVSAAEAATLIEEAREAQSALISSMKHELGKDSWDAGEEGMPWFELVRLLPRIVGPGVLRTQAVAAFQAHAVLEGAGPEYARELLADAMSVGQPVAVARGAEQVAAALGLADLAPTVPRTDHARKGTLGPKPVPPRSAEEDEVTMFRRLWRDRDYSDAAQLLRVVPREQFAELLHVTLASRDELARAYAYRALGDRRMPESNALLLQGLRDPDAYVRAAAIDGLAAMRVRLDAAQTSQLLRDPNASVKAAVLRGSERSGWPINDSMLLQALKSDEPTVREAAWRAARNASHEVRGVLAELLRARSESDAPSAANALSAARGGGEALDVVLRMSQAERASVYRVLRSLRPEVVTAPLRALLETPDEARRAGAADILGLMRTPVLLGELENLATSDRSVDVRTAAVGALGAIGMMGSVTALKRAARDSEPRVRAAALSALYGIDEHAMFEEALLLARDESPLVRARVVRLLTDVEVPQARDALARLRGDTADEVRREFPPTTPSLGEQDKQAILALDPEQQVEAVCRRRTSDPAFAVLTASRIAADIELPEAPRARVLSCVRDVAAAGMTPQAMQLLQQVIFDPAMVRFVRIMAYEVVEKSHDIGGPQLIFAGTFSDLDGAGCGGGRNFLGGFSARVVNDAARPYALHPNPLVRALAAQCVGQRDMEPLRSTVGGGDLARRVLEVLSLRTPAQSADGIAALLRERHLPTELRDRLLVALWKTRTEAGHVNAVAYRGAPARLGVVEMEAWTAALYSRPSPEALARMLAELDRVHGAAREGDFGAKLFDLSAAVPDAPLDVALIARFADSLAAAELTWRLSGPRKTFSPVGFLSVCLAGFPQSDDGGAFLYGEPVRVLPTQRAALARSAGACRREWDARGGLMPAAVRGWLKRLYLNAGLPDEAAAVPSTNDASPFGSAFVLVSHAEALLEKGDTIRARGVLDDVEREWQPQLNDATHVAEVRDRVLLLRGLIMHRAGDEAQAGSFLRAAADRAHSSATGIAAFGFALRYGVFNPMHRARELLKVFDETEQRSPLLDAAIEEILVYNAEHHVRAGRPQDSLLAADRLLQFQTTREKPQTLALGDDEKAQTLLQLRDLEDRVFRLSQARGNAESTQVELAAARKELKTWVTSLRLRHPAAAMLLRPAEIDLQEIKRRLGPSRALIQYVLLPHSGYAWVVTSQGTNVVPIPQSESTIRAWVAQARAQFTPGLILRSARVADLDESRGATLVGATPKRVSSASESQEGMARLADALIKPVIEAAGAYDHWVIVPHASLHAVPFAALHLPGAGGPLVVKKTVSVLGSVAALESFGERAAAAPRVLALGNPPPFSSEWAPLPGAEAEVNRIKELWPGADVEALLGSSAVRAAIIGRRLENTALHFALHGEAGGGDKSRLVLADGFLTLGDIWGLALDGSPRVVLSACETALGGALVGNEILSLANGFLFAGARSVVASLWRVPDEDTRLLMEDLYREIAAGRSTAHAMSAAQRKAIANGRSPHAWAAFIVNGL
jgi:CHAT domain-containing protein/TPR repeat protein/HEAT repeat protein